MHMLADSTVCRYESTGITLLFYKDDPGPTEEERKSEHQENCFNVRERRSEYHVSPKPVRESAPLETQVKLT